MSLIVSLFLSVWFTIKMLWEINVKISLFILPLYLLFVLLAYRSWQICFTASQMRKRHKLRDFHHGSRPFRSSLPVQTVTGSLALLIILRLLNHRLEKQWNVNFLGYIILWFTVHLSKASSAFWNKTWWNVNLIDLFESREIHRIMFFS